MISVVIAVTPVTASSAVRYDHVAFDIRWSHNAPPPLGDLSRVSRDTLISSDRGGSPPLSNHSDPFRFWHLNGGRERSTSQESKSSRLPNNITLRSGTRKSPRLRRGSTPTHLRLRGRRRYPALTRHQDYLPIHHKSGADGTTSGHYPYQLRTQNRDPQRTCPTHRHSAWGRDSRRKTL